MRRARTALAAAAAAVAVLLVHFRSTSQDAVDAAIDRLRGHLRVPGLTLAYDGYEAEFLDANRAVRTDLVRAELIAFPALAILMLLIFRGVIAAAIPLVIGGASIAITFACLRLLSQVVGISIFALDLALLLGLGLAVDYGLFLVSRYREEVPARGVGRDAIQATLATAGRAVALSALAVGAACAVLLVFPQDFIHSMGVAGVLVALLSAGAALLLTPPLLLLAGRRVVARSGEGDRSAGYWERWGSWVSRRPFDVAVVGVLLLIAAAAPTLRMKTTFPDQTAVPPGYESRKVAELIDRDVLTNLGYPVNIAVLRAKHAALPPALLPAALGRAPGVAAVSSIQYASRSVGFIQLILRDPQYSRRSQSLVTALRASHEPLLIGGNTAAPQTQVPARARVGRSSK